MDTVAAPPARQLTERTQSESENMTIPKPFQEGYEDPLPRKSVPLPSHNDTDSPLGIQQASHEANLINDNALQQYVESTEKTQKAVQIGHDYPMSLDVSSNPDVVRLKSG